MSTAATRVPSYLRRILSAARALAAAAATTSSDGDDDDGGRRDDVVEVDDEEEEEEPTTADRLMERIAVELLAACRPSTLSSSTDDLPPLPVAEIGPHDLPDDYDGGERRPRGDGGEKNGSGRYRHRRVDYLRSLLRAAAPVAADAAARVCSRVSAVQRRRRTADSAKGDRAIDLEARRAALVLFSVWLPVAPHLADMAMDLFSLRAFACPFSPPSSSSSSADPSLPELHVLMEAAHAVCRFFCGHRREHAHLARWWNWSPVFRYLCSTSADEDTGDAGSQFSASDAVRWHAARAAGFVLNLAPHRKAEFFKHHRLQAEDPVWVMHPWELDDEECSAERQRWGGKMRIWWAAEPDAFDCPDVTEIRAVVPLHPYLVEVGNDGLVFVRQGAIRDPDLSPSPQPSDDHGRRLVRTATTARNLGLVGAALCIDPHPPPILLTGPQGTGKSSLIRELAQLFSASLLEIHVDEDTDTKTLVGSCTATDVPGEFAWRPGALTNAVRTGQWVLLEDLDKVPVEIQCSLTDLFKERLLPLGNGETEMCHPHFRLFGTLTSSSSSSSNASRPSSTTTVVGTRILHPHAWQQVRIEPLPVSELKEIAVSLHPQIPEAVVDAALRVFRSLDRSGRSHEEEEEATQHRKMWLGRHPSVRDLFKVLSRITNGVPFEPNVTYATESQRTLCLAEIVDVFAAACPEAETRREFIVSLAAPIFGITGDLARSYVEMRSPVVLQHAACTEVGRVRLPVTEAQALVREETEHFAQTDYSLRLMESIAVCVRENEPTLLVGETGTGKTTILQCLAKMSGRELVVQNLSLQTDSTDLLGGYRPLEIEHVARMLYQDFVDLFTGTFSRKQNAEFLSFVSSAFQKSQWKKLSQCFRRASKLGMNKVRERESQGERHLLDKQWRGFYEASDRFEKQRMACDSGLAFVFTEGALVHAIREGKWVLLDEINLASSETLQRLCGLLDNSSGSLTLTERGDSDSIERHPEFRLFAAMNPATDAGKKDLSSNVRARFTELYVDELVDPVELRLVAASYISSVMPPGDRPPEHTESVILIVDLYLECRELAERSLVDGGGQKPRYTLRTLSRALTAARNFVINQKLPLSRALYEGFELAFQGPLDEASLRSLRKVIDKSIGKSIDKASLDHPGRRPGGRGESIDYVLLKPFWIEAGPLQRWDWAEEASARGRSRFVLTKSTRSNLRRLARAVASGPWPILLEGPTSAGKTTLVEYLGARCGHHVVRINNHEHTDVQEYTGGFAADSNGSLTFQEGVLVRALRHGHWVILDELNLAPTEVLEALNRLLDDNRELFLPDINQTVKPHPNFRLFATQNPSGAYGGRKPLSRAFRNRFIEIHVGDIPSSEMYTILRDRCACPPSHAKSLVDVMDDLHRRRSRSGVFLGKDGFITARDLLRWAERGASSKLDLAREGYMLLAERLRTPEEKECVKEVLESHLKVSIEQDDFYYGDRSEARKLFQQVRSVSSGNTSPGSLLSSIAPTKTLLRLLTLVSRCVKQREPVLLVGDTGCGKTVSVQLLSQVLGTTLHTVNCHQTTETSDLIGGLRPVRGRSSVASNMLRVVKKILTIWPDNAALETFDIPDFVMRESLGSEGSETSLPDDAVSKMVHLTRALFGTARSVQRPVSKPEARENKRQKLESNIQSSLNEKEDLVASMLPLATEVENLFVKYNSLFEWADGPLVRAMKAGELILIDEMNLAEDAVLERLNSVLEPSRTLVLAEKGGLGEDGNLRIEAKDGFQVFATMNPGGDFGKRELSPALRNRFTEIWVPQVTDDSEISLVLESTFSNSEAPDVDVVKHHMMEYVHWFNEKICADPTNSFTDHALSLRDILTWARFVVAVCRTNATLHIWEAYLHGARLMHLDGLGLGTGMALDDVESIRRQAEALLRDQLSRIGMSAETSVSLNFTRDGERFGSEPFWISAGFNGNKNEGFSFEAPTTALNIIRVLRAMQLSKPVLLEGNPGVGKTALISALASASGHNLVRINLSEQTDISDLVGSDLPVPEGDLSGSAKASFRWCDGVLLSAIKKGDWVLLDELNLASQSVLEGLNSCLDHRASVYVPELGRCFDCPSSFRVFAAQNPLAQGGGRKGLPKSFLNRFTKVYVDTFSNGDIRLIVNCRFPGQVGANEMVEFNSRVHREVVQLRSFGQAGSPWEFNLRDIFRWCELFAARAEESSNKFRFARYLYLQRFRTSKDREQLASLYFALFSRDAGDAEHPKLAVFASSFRIGNVLLSRSGGSSAVDQNDGRLGAFIPFRLLEPTEAVAQCIQMNWPCLLVGGMSTGKSSLIRTLADACNASLKEVALSPSSDVSELVGCFEQEDKYEQFKAAVNSLITLASGVVLGSGAQDVVGRISYLLLSLQPSLKSLHGASLLEENLSCALEMVSLLGSSNLDSSGCEHLERITKVLQSLREDDREDAHFAWKDGVLVRAMTEGHWLHLKHANMCPASVLDRLNPVMEPGGYLLLAECGIDSSSGSDHRIVRCHPNFRIFLSMNPDHGEVSRAMRNRCIEISLLNRKVGDSPRDSLDGLEFLRRSGLRSATLASALLRNHVELANSAYGADVEIQGSRPLEVTGSVVSSLSNRGVLGSSILSISQRLVYQIGVIDARKTSVGMDLDLMGKLPYSSKAREDWVLCPCVSTAAWESRVLRLFSSTEEIQSSIHKGTPLFTLLSSNELLLSSNGCLEDLRNHLMILFLTKAASQSVSEKGAFFDRLQGGLMNSLHFLADYLHQLFRFERTSVEAAATLPIWNSLHRHPVVKILVQRMPQVLKEHVWCENARKSACEMESDQQISVLAASLSVTEGRLDRCVVDCPVVPVIYSFFLGSDRWVASLTSASRRTGEKLEYLASCLGNFLSRRDRLWDVLSDEPFSPDSSSFLGFDETKFIVQWRWVRKSFSFMKSLCSEIGISVLDESQRDLEGLVECIDNAILQADGITGENGILGSSVSKCVVAPLVPRKAEEWDCLLALRELSHSASIDLVELGCGDSTCFDVQSLVELRHPVFFVGTELRIEILGALCMIHLASTDELQVNGWTKLLGTIPDLPKVIRKEIREAQESFGNLLKVARFGSAEGETMLDTRELKHLMSESIESSYRKLSNDLLRRFSMIQVAPCFQYWCESQEIELIRSLCQILLVRFHVGMHEQLRLLREQMGRFVDVAIARTVWEVADLRPYQTLLWVSEAEQLEDDIAERLISRVLPTMFCNVARRAWSNSFQLSRSISSCLELPTLIDEDFRKRTRDSEEGLTPLAGGRRHVPTTLVYDLIGDAFVAKSRGSKVATIENFQVRESQSCDLVDALGLQNSSEGGISRPYEVNLLLADTIQSLRDSFPGDAGDELLLLVKHTDGLHLLCRERIRLLAGTSDNALFRSLVEPLVLPLFDSLKGLWGFGSIARDKFQDYAVAMVCLGLLRLHLLIPDSPLDPGRKYVAKISLIDRQLSTVAVQLGALQLDSALISGEINPENADTRHLLEERERLLEKRSRSEKKVIERPESAPAFVDLYRETRQFSRTVAQLDGVLSLLDMMRDSGFSNSSSEVLMQRTSQWQMTSEAFCRSLISKYEAYEDITAPLVASVGFIKRGIGLLVAQFDSKTSNRWEAADLKLCEDFPLRRFPDGIDRLVSIAGLVDCQARGGAACRRALALAASSHLLLQRQLIGLNEAVFSSWFSVLDVILGGTDESSRDELSVVLDEELRFREQFPDHRKEFQSLVKDRDATEELMEDKQGKIEESGVEEAQMDDEYRDMLCFFHRSLFLPGEVKPNDNDRLNLFRLCYSAAASLFREATEASKSIFLSNEETASGHVLALSLVTVSKGHPRSGSLHTLSFSERPVDFHRDPNPHEAVKAARPLESLMARIAQLMKAFPGNALLLSVARVAERVRKLDVLSTSLGKMMTGLEVILKHAQDWEQHASDRVLLGEPLAEVSRLVSTWRKMELQSWPELLDTREELFVRRARKHWVLIHLVLQKKFLPRELQKKDEHMGPRLQISPRWVWKGLARAAERLSAFSGEVLDDSSEIVKALDTFFLTSSLGEFRERLRIVEAFAHQIEQQSRLSEGRDGRPLLARALKSLWMYYDQFLPMLEHKLKELRSPLETRLQQEVKLAKWDEQTYYALAESTERNHRKLMTILREYDEILETSVAALLENELCRGIRSDSSTKKDGTSSIPSDSDLFTLQLTEKRVSSSQSSETFTSGRTWSNPSLLGAKPDSPVLKLEHYCRKMDSLLNGQLVESQTSAAGCGASRSESLCETIFQRIGALRSENTTRPMKERALVDLFKKLKQEGYASTKWSSPPEARQIGNLFQLPVPTSSDSLLRESEVYYQRCLSEVQRLRTEVAMLGSEHMTTNQLDLMAAFADHGVLLLAQQRCVLSSIISQRAPLAEKIETMSFSNFALPLSQAVLRSRVHAFQKDFIFSLESIRQLLLLIKTSEFLLSRKGKGDWARSIVTRLESFLSEIPTCFPTKPAFVSESQLQEVEKIVIWLKNAGALLVEYRESCVELRCLPCTAFDTCLSQVRKAIDSSSLCFDPQPEKDLDHAVSDLAAFIEVSSKSVVAGLQCVQAFLRDDDGNFSDNDHMSESIWSLHRAAARRWASADVYRVNQRLDVVADQLRGIHESKCLEQKNRVCCVRLAADLGFLYSKVLAVINRHLRESISFYRATAKLNYVLLRIFRVLIAKGYCSDKAREDPCEGGEGGVSSMTFEDDKEGTGMGEGEGSRDVTDQLENEEQLLGNKGDDSGDGKGTGKQESKQLDKDEADTGMEMEGDFDGEMYDMPEKGQEENNEMDEDGGEELDREMGDDRCLNEEVIDEKLWGESDDEEDTNRGEEKFEQNSSVKGDPAADEVTTKEDNEREAANEKEAEQSSSAGDKQEMEESAETDGNNNENDMINEDAEDRYEESHGVKVRDDRTDEDENRNDDELELEEELTLEEGSSAGPDEVSDNDEDHAESASGDANPEQPVEEEGQPESPESEEDSPVTAGHADQVALDPEDNEQAEEEPEQIEQPRINLPKDLEHHRGLGTRDQDGNDAILDAMDEEDQDGPVEETAEQEKAKRSEGPAGEPSGPEGSSSGRGQGQSFADLQGQEQQKPSEEIPNPLKSLGDAAKFWHKKLNVGSQTDVEQTDEIVEDADDDENQDSRGEFQHVKHNQSSATQALGEVDQEDAARLEDRDGETSENADELENSEVAKCAESSSRTNQRRSAEKAVAKDEAELDVAQDMDVDEESDRAEEDAEANEMNQGGDESETEDDLTAEKSVQNRVVADFSQLHVQDNDEGEIDRPTIVEEEQATGISSAEAAEARIRWSHIQSETHLLSRRLCEKLRLVMEPLVASRLRGDYRTGKRIHMKRVIGYIASGYRKDKIWLRRTKPAKRNYRVLLAVDDSESMLKSGAGEMALRAMATLAVGMSQLEVGQIGIASFGDDMKLVHPFHLPFTSDSGSQVVQHFRFDQQRTRTAMCVESACKALEDSVGDHAPIQLVFLVTDGRIERDSRATLRRLVREMVEQSILLVVVIVEGNNVQKKDSIVNMKEVKFEKGKPKVKPFLDDYPFPYYIVLDDMHSLPEVLGDTLRQWFEMLARLHGSS